MNGNFEDRIKNIELELLALKTSSLYTSIRNTVTTHSNRVSTGTYKITYATNGESIMSEFYSDMYKKSKGEISPRTPIGSSQVVDINTTYISPDGVTPVTYDISLVVVSNVPVTSITRI